MRLNGNQQKQLHNALLAAFPTRADLTRFVRFQLNENLNTIASDSKLSDIVFTLIEWAEANGRILELITQAREANSGNPELQAFEAAHLDLLDTGKTSEPQDVVQPPSTKSASVREGKDSFAEREEPRSVFDSLVLITSVDPAKTAVYGTGFVVHHDAQYTYLLTCAHVVRDVGGPEKTLAASLPVTVVAIGDDLVLDLAVLRVEGLTEVPALKLQVAGKEGEAIQAIGFQLTGSNYILRPLKGTLGTQVEIGLQGQTGRARAWDLNITDDYKVQRGYSGSPVVYPQTGTVIAVVNQQQGGGAKGTGISLTTLPLIWKSIPDALLSVQTKPISTASPVAAASGGNEETEAINTRKFDRLKTLKIKSLEERRDLLTRQYEAAMNDYNQELSGARRVVLDRQAKDLEEQIAEVDNELLKLKSR